MDWASAMWMRDQRLFALSSRLTRLETVRILRKLPTTNNRSISCVNYSPYSKRPKFTLYTDWIVCMYLVVLTMVLIHSSLRCIFKFNLASWFIHVIRCYFQVNTFQMQIFTVFKFKFFFSIFFNLILFHFVTLVLQFSSSLSLSLDVYLHDKRLGLMAFTN